MANGIADVFLVGNLSRDPELKTLSTGTMVCRLGVAVGSSYKTSDGAWKETVSFFDVDVWGAQGENCAKFLVKGQQVSIAGRLQQRTWDAEDGTKRSAVQVAAERVIFGQKPGQGGNSKPDSIGDDDINF